MIDPVEHRLDRFEQSGLMPGGVTCPAELYCEIIPQIAIRANGFATAIAA